MVGTIVTIGNEETEIKEVRYLTKVTQLSFQFRNSLTPEPTGPAISLYNWRYQSYKELQ